MSQSEELAPLPPPVVRYAPVGDIKLYIVHESELEQLANGSPESIFLNLSLVLLPTGLSLLVTLLTTKIEAFYTLASFVAICFSSFILGLAFLFLWWRSRVSTKKLIEEIKQRMPPPPGIQEKSA